MDEIRAGINTDYIKLDSLLKFSGVCATGGEAKDEILSGGVKLNGESCTQRGRKIKPGDIVEIGGVRIVVDRI